MFLHSWRDALLRHRARLIKIGMSLAILGLSALMGLRTSPYFLILLGGAGGMVLLLQRPALGLVVLAGLSFTLPLELGTGSEVALTPPVLLIPGVILAWLVDGMWKRQPLRLPTSRPTLPLLLFVGSGLLSLLAGTAYWDPAVPRPGNLLLVQVAQWAIFALSAVVFLLAGELGRGTRWLQYATWVFLILAGVVVLENYVPWLHQLVGWCDPSRAKSGVFWGWLGALAAGQLAFNRRLGSFAKVALSALLIATTYLVLFLWREWLSGWGPFVIAVLAVAWLRVWRHSRRVGVMAILAGVVLAVVLFPILFAHAGGERELEVSWGGRLALYRAVLDLTKPHPILGLGPAAYRHYGYTHSLWMGAGKAFYRSVWLSSHNNYIDIYAQVGLVGLGLFLWFLAEVGLLGWRLTTCFQGDFKDGYVHGALGGLAGSLVAMMLVDWFLPYVYNVGFRGFRTSALAWMFLGGLVALEQVAGGAEVRVSMADGNPTGSHRLWSSGSERAT
jgi:O-antigen ligase